MTGKSWKAYEKSSVYDHLSAKPTMAQYLIAAADDVPLKTVPALFLIGGQERRKPQHRNQEAGLHLSAALCRVGA